MAFCKVFFGHFQAHEMIIFEEKGVCAVPSLTFTDELDYRTKN